MEYIFSEAVAGLKPSAIREILKMSSQPGIIPFSAGNPSAEAFPVEAFQKISASVLSDAPIDALQYSITEGYMPLRKHLLTYMRDKHRVGTDADDILITAGAQQVMNLTAKVLGKRGGAIACENPSFIGSLNAFRSFGLELVGVPVEADGMDVDYLRSVLESGKKLDFIYTIPNFQNPSGITMSLEKRKALYALAVEYQVPILEDNPYGDLRFRGESLPCIKSFDTEGIVIYAGSFSKVLSPGLRVGYAIADKKLLSKLIVCKQTDDVHTTSWPQILAYRFMTEYDYEAHLEHLREIYRKKALFTMELADKYLMPDITYFAVDGGLFLWCGLPAGKDMMQFCRDALQRKVAVVPGTAFLTDTEANTNYFRINYSTPSNEQIEQGIQILGDLVRGK